MEVRNLFNKIFIKHKNNNIDYEKLPEHIGIIMDGNGRWAKKRGLPRSAGHRAGARTLREITEFCGEIGIKVVTVYAFSTENWKRPKEEVNALMDLLLEYLRDAENKLAGKNVVIRVIGDTESLSSAIQKQIITTESFTKSNTGLILNIAINYGGRDEIMHAVRQVIKDVKLNKIDIHNITEEYFSTHMYTKGIKDPDLIIRPSGEQRLSNFLLWQSAYSEFWYSKICWPDFKSHHLLDAIYDYQKRKRRFGGI